MQVNIKTDLIESSGYFGLSDTSINKALDDQVLNSTNSGIHKFVKGANSPLSTDSEMITKAWNHLLEEAQLPKSAWTMEKCLEMQCNISNADDQKSDCELSFDSPDDFPEKRH